MDAGRIMILVKFVVVCVLVPTYRAFCRIKWDVGMCWYNEVDDNQGDVADERLIINLFFILLILIK